MNCKPGDLAVIVRSMAGNEGLIVEVIEHSELSPEYDWLIRAPRAIRWAFGDISDIGHAKDSCLRPIRDNDGEDEMLRIVGKPQEVTA